MKLKIGLALAGLVAVVLSLGVGRPGGVAQAEEPDGVRPLEAPAFDDYFMARPWLRRSIIHCAAETMSLEVWQVVAGLRNGHSLKEIGIRAGVRPERLEYGILRCERGLLARLVETGQLEPGEARRIFNFLEAHITRIINFKWNPNDEALTE